jgi:hypothetical protein
LGRKTKKNSLLTTAPRILLGLIFLVGIINSFSFIFTGSHLIHRPTSDKGLEFEAGLKTTGFFWPLMLAGLAPDGSRFKVRNDFFRADGQLAAKVTSTGGFLDLDFRKLVAPPIEILTTYQAIPKADDYETLPSSLKAS